MPLYYLYSVISSNGFSKLITAYTSFSCFRLSYVTIHHSSSAAKFTCVTVIGSVHHYICCVRRILLKPRDLGPITDIIYIFIKAKQ